MAISALDGMSFEPFLFSKAHSCFAPSIWRRLLMHAFADFDNRARMKSGIAITTTNPKTTTNRQVVTHFTIFSANELFPSGALIQ